MKITKNIAYLRVSTAEQDLEKNKLAILKLAHDKNLGQVTFVEEKISGKVPWRKRKIAAIINDLQKGDNIILSELSRLGRSMLECMEIIAIASKKGIGMYTVKGDWQLNNSIQSKIVAMTFAMAAEIERDLISKRTKEALQARKAQGKSLGRPKGRGKRKLDVYKEEIHALLANGSTKRHIAKKYGVSEGAVYYWLRGE